MGEFMPYNRNVKLCAEFETFTSKRRLKEKDIRYLSFVEPWKVYTRNGTYLTGRQHDFVKREMA